MPSGTVGAGRVTCGAATYDTDTKNQFLAPRAKGSNVGRIAAPLPWSRGPVVRLLHHMAVILKGP
jgi:hypothetical protein